VEGNRERDGEGGNSKGKGIGKQTPEVNQISRAVDLRLQMEMYVADSVTEGWLERVYLKPYALPAMSISPDDDLDSTQELDVEYDSEHDSDVDMRMQDDVDASCGVDLHGNADMERDSDDEEEENEEEEDEEEEDNEEEDEDEEQDEDEDDGKEPRMIGQGEMVNTSADNVYTMVDNQPSMLHEQGQEMSDHTPRPQPPAPAPRLRTPEPCPPSQTVETHPLGGLEFLVYVTPQ